MIFEDGVNFKKDEPFDFNTFNCPSSKGELVSTLHVFKNQCVHCVWKTYFAMAEIATHKCGSEPDEMKTHFE